MNEHLSNSNVCWDELCHQFPGKEIIHCGRYCTHYFSQKPKGTFQTICPFWSRSCCCVALSKANKHSLLVILPICSMVAVPSILRMRTRISPLFFPMKWHLIDQSYKSLCNKPKGQRRKCLQSQVEHHSYMDFNVVEFVQCFSTNRYISWDTQKHTPKQRTTRKTYEYIMTRTGIFSPSRPTIYLQNRVSSSASTQSVSASTVAHSTVLGCSAQCTKKQRWSYQGWYTCNEEDNREIPWFIFHIVPRTAKHLLISCQAFFFLERNGCCQKWRECEGNLGEYTFHPFLTYELFDYIKTAASFPGASTQTAWEKGTLTEQILSLAHI